MSQQLKNGVDMVKIERFETLHPAIRARFINRVYTPNEIKLCANRNESLAGRFAAQEAVAKTLGCGIGPVRWQDIEIIATADLQPELVLHGPAAEIAKQQGLKLWSVSITHTHEYAMAFVVALGTTTKKRSGI
jgi:holo-[acyl-carrier protein] synthase